MITKGELTEYLNIFAANLRRHRNNLTLTYEQVAHRTGIAKSIMSRIENGQTSPSFDTFLRLHLFLGVDTTFFRSDPSSSTDADLPPLESLSGGSKFKRKNFFGRPAITAEIEYLDAGAARKLRSRRSCEENLLVLAGSCTIAYENSDPVELNRGEIYTIPLNRLDYEISSEDGATIMRISAPLSTDRSAGTRYLTVMGRTVKGTGGEPS